MHTNALIVLVIYLVLPISQCAPFAIPAPAIVARSPTYSVVQVNGGSSPTTKTTTTTVFATTTDVTAVSTTVTQILQPVVVIQETETVVYTSFVTKSEAVETVVVTKTVLAYGGSPAASTSNAASINIPRSSASLISTTSESTMYISQPSKSKTFASTSAASSQINGTTRRVNTTATSQPYMTVLTLTRPAQTIVESIMFEGFGAAPTAVPMTTVLRPTTFLSTRTISAIDISRTTTTAEPISAITSTHFASTTTTTYDFILQTYTTIAMSTTTRATHTTSTTSCTSLLSSTVT